MNIINTVGDLKRALSVYDDELPLQVRDTERNSYSLNNDTQLAHVSDAEYEHFEIVLVKPTAPLRSRMTVTMVTAHDALRMGQAFLDIGHRLTRGELEYVEGGISVDYLHAERSYGDGGRVVTQVAKAATGISISGNILLKVKK